MDQIGARGLAQIQYEAALPSESASVSHASGITVPSWSNPTTEPITAPQAIINAPITAEAVPDIRGNISMSAADILANNSALGPMHKMKSQTEIPRRLF